jgi:hypothetical protein
LFSGGDFAYDRHPVDVKGRIRWGIDGARAVALRRLLPAVLGALAVVLVFVTPAFALGGFEYKLHLKVEGKTTLSSQAGGVAQDTVNQKATWTVLPVDVNVWIPQFNGPPGQANAKETEVQTTDERGANASVGKVEESGTYKSSESEDAIPFSCQAPILYTGPIVQRTIVTPLDPTVELETDFQGSLGVEHNGGFGVEVGEPCYTENDTEKTEVKGLFYYQWDQPHGLRIQVGTLIPQQEVGQSSISGPAEDYNNVVVSEPSNSDCEPGGTCEQTFKLSGEYELELICAGSESPSGWGCSSGGSSGGSSSSENPKSGGGGEKQQEEEAKKKQEEEAAKAAAAKKTEEAKKEEEKRQKEAESKKHAEEAKASVKIESVKLTAAGLLVKLKTSEAGTVTIAGAGLTRLAKMLPAGVHTGRVAVSMKARAKHQKTRLTVSLKVGKKTVTAFKELTL